MQKSPNILVIQADQMSAKALSLYSNSLVKMPNLERLAAKGVVFENAYCNFPLCTPSRSSMMTGRYANAISQWDNATELPASTPTLAHYLRDVNYHTVLCGKMHFIGPDQVHGFNERVTTDIYPSNFAWTPDWIVGERYRPTGINMRAVVDAGICTRGLQIDYDEEVAHSAVQKLYDLARFNKDKPFLLWTSFTHPHSPYITTQHYWDLYSHSDIDMPSVPRFKLQEMDTMSRWLYYAHGGDLHKVNDSHILNARHAYYGMCTYIDDKLGQLLDALEKLGIEDETTIIFTADHGEMLGERGMWFKQTFYEWSTRIPLIIKTPKQKKAVRIKKLVSLVDLLPTLMDIATNSHSPPPISPLDGHSLMPLINHALQSKKTTPLVKWDNRVISEYTGEGVITPCRMIRRDDIKLIYTHGYPDLMYDLSQDPLELNNLIGKPEYAAIEQQLKIELLKNWHPQTIYESCIQSQKDRLFIQKTTQGYPNYAFDYRTGDTHRYIRNDSAVGIKAKARYPFVEPTPFIR